MTRGLQERIDCERLAQDGVALERVYALADLPRIQDLLADRIGTIRAKFLFARCPSGRPGVAVEVAGTAQLVCQRCMSGFAYPVAAHSEIEFATAAALPAESERDLYVLDEGLASLAEIAEEEFLLALPLVPVCDERGGCARAQAVDVDGGGETVRTTVRPFGALGDLLKKTDRT